MNNKNVEIEIESSKEIIKMISDEKKEEMIKGIEIFVKDLKEFHKRYPESKDWIKSNNLSEPLYDDCSNLGMALQIVLGERVVAFDYTGDMMEVIPELNKSVGGELEKSLKYKESVEYFEENEMEVQEGICESKILTNYIKKFGYICYAFWQDTDQVFIFLVKKEYEKEMKEKIKFFPQISYVN